ncbi:MAG: PorT family protein [Bacteroidales bacterium]|nr:PorT family protein [Bacteroidales bacterium]
MCKRVLVFILLIMSIGGLAAQNINDKNFWGVKVGANFPRLYYSDKNLKELPHDMMVGPTVGLFYEFKLYKTVSMAVEIDYQQRGGATSYVYENKYNVNYKLKAHYASLRLPFTWYMIGNKDFSPYLYVAPDFGYAFGGTISLTQPGLPISDVSVGISDSNINRLNIGILGGLGVRKNVNLTNWILVLKVDAALSYGFINTFSPSETNETATPTNIHAYNSQGKRHSVGLEINLSLGFERIGAKPSKSTNNKSSKGSGKSKGSKGDCFPFR